MTKGHNALNTWPHCPGCFSSITAGMSDAVGAAAKPVIVVQPYLYSAHSDAGRSQVEIDPAKGSPKVDFRMVLVLRSEELGRTAYMGVQPTHGTVQGSHG